MTIQVPLAVLAILAGASGAGAEPALTIYNQNFAVVRDHVMLDGKPGENEVRFADTTAHLEPDSVILRDPQGRINLQVLEQNYRNDPVSQELLLSLFEGKTIDFLVTEPNKPNTIAQGKIIRSGYLPHGGEAMQRYGQRYMMSQRSNAYGPSGVSQPIIEVDGKLGFSLPGQPLFPPLANDAATTLRDRETKQMEFIRARGVKSERIYVYDGLKIDPNRWRGYNMENIRNNSDTGNEMDTKVAVMREFKNSEANHLGLPLPKGVLRFYKQDSDQQLEFTGENLIDHTPKDETLRVYTGNAFDLVGERKRTAFKVDSANHWFDESSEITLRSHTRRNRWRFGPMSTFPLDELENHGQLGSLHEDERAGDRVPRPGEAG